MSKEYTKEEQAQIAFKALKRYQLPLLALVADNLLDEAINAGITKTLMNKWIKPAMSKYKKSPEKYLNGYEWNFDEEWNIKQRRYESLLDGTNNFFDDSEWRAHPTLREAHKDYFLNFKYPCQYRFFNRTALVNPNDWDHFYGAKGVVMDDDEFDSYIRNQSQTALNWATFLDQLTDEYTPIPWLIDGLIRVGERSDMYGQAGAGKTYLALDMGFSIAQGKPWMGRNTLEGLVLYIASENPQSVEARMKAYRTHLKYKGESLCIYKKPFDLFNSDSDSNDLIEFINTSSKTKGKPFRLIIFDTLSKVMVGANENLTADMNKVMAKIDRIISNAQAHCMVLHHTGKDPSKGARGSNSLLGAIDTELKVDRLQSSRYIEVTKQRDGNDGERIGFDIQSSNLKDQDGNPILNEKGEPINIAIVVAKDSPTNFTRATRVNKIEKAILSDLENTEGLNRTLLVKAIADKVGHKKPNHVYIKLADLVSIGKVMQTERDGESWVSLATPS